MTLGLLRVDFNECDDDRLVALLPENTQSPEVGTEIHLLDGDGNYCRGMIEAVQGRIARIAPDWSTWWPDAYVVVFVLGLLVGPYLLATLRSGPIGVLGALLGLVRETGFYLCSAIYIVGKWIVGTVSWLLGRNHP